MASSEEKRTSVRVPVDMEGTYKMADLIQNIKILNLSYTGCFLMGPELIDPGDSIDLSFRIPGSQNETLVEGRVAWGGVMEGRDRRSFGIGVHFENLTPSQKEEIEQFIRNLLKL